MGGQTRRRLLLRLARDGVVRAWWNDAQSQPYVTIRRAAMRGSLPQELITLWTLS
jgi:hypothetical protein